MVAVSLSEAWNEPPSEEEKHAPAPRKQSKFAPVPHAQSKPVAARRATRFLRDDDEEEGVEYVEEQEEVLSIPSAPSAAKLEVEESPRGTPVICEDILAQLQAVRREESRRCTIYLCVSGILFAILFVYIDRLQQQVRLLNTCLLHRQLSSVVAFPNSLHT